MLTGALLSSTDTDRQYLVDLGLIRVDSGGMRPANGIYAEVLPRVLASLTQETFHFVTPLTPNAHLFLGQQSVNAPARAVSRQHALPR